MPEEFANSHEFCSAEFQNTTYFPVNKPRPILSDKFLQNDFLVSFQHRHVDNHQ